MSEVPTIISAFYKKYKGEGARKLSGRIRKTFTGISRERIQSWINSNKDHCKRNPIFDNKDPLQPVIEHETMNRIQIDLVIMENKPSISPDGITYRYILSVLDIFSRFLFLRPLQSKESLEVANNMKEIFITIGNPNIIQSDGGSEFKGILHFLTYPFLDPH